MYPKCTATRAAAVIRTGADPVLKGAGRGSTVGDDIFRPGASREDRIEDEERGRRSVSPRSEIHPGREGTGHPEGGITVGIII